MKINSLNQGSFRGAYLVKGQTEILDEICWFLQRKRIKPENNFDFLDIRNCVKVPKTLEFKRGEKIDLFLTQQDKKSIMNPLNNINNDSVMASIGKKTITFDELFKKVEQTKNFTTISAKESRLQPFFQCSLKNILID